MSTHILSDVEALCDEVAILRSGKLAATGNLSDLLSAQNSQQVYEVNIKGVSTEALSARFPSVSIVQKPNGVTVQVTDENEIDGILAEARKSGGKLMSVQPVRQSLEELFVEKTDAS